MTNCTLGARRIGDKTTLGYKEQNSADAEVFSVVTNKLFGNISGMEYINLDFAPVVFWVHRLNIEYSLLFIAELSNERASMWSELWHSLEVIPMTCFEV